ncbi:SAM-dependent methyltransferase [soil metagenome]
MSEINADRLAESRPELVEIIRAEIERDGRITFARFMELAIGHSEFGYYATGEVRAAFSGDFLTAPETHAIFGQTLVRQIDECWQHMGNPDRFTVREDGAGRGTLALDILSELHDRFPNLYRATTYELADLNPSRVEEGLQRLAELGYGDRIRAASGEPFDGLLLANELLDAFPVHRLIQHDGELREVYVIWKNGWFDDQIGPLSDPELTGLLSGVALTEGQRAEVSPQAIEWSGSICRQLSSGYAILIDYGYPASELYSEVHFDGTLKGYSRHDVTDDPYLRVGNQDLTAHVNFTAVSAAAQSGGCVELGLTNQAYFLAGLGIEQVLLQLQKTDATPHEYVLARDAVLHLIDPGGLGRFRVLLLGKNIEPEPPLRGFSFRL